MTAGWHLAADELDVGLWNQVRQSQASALLDRKVCHIRIGLAQFLLACRVRDRKGTPPKNAQVARNAVLF